MYYNNCSNILELPSNISAEVIRSSLIDPDKIIIMNIVDTVSSGLIVVNIMIIVTICRKRQIGIDTSNLKKKKSQFIGIFI
jgi:hypothetical protein